MLAPLEMDARVAARNWFREVGISINDWAVARGFEPGVCYAVLAGRIKGDRGEAHRIAVALGLKAQSLGIEAAPPQSFRANPGRVSLLTPPLR